MVQRGLSLKRNPPIHPSIATPKTRLEILHISSSSLLSFPLFFSCFCFFLVLFSYNSPSLTRFSCARAIAHPIFCFDQRHLPTLEPSSVVRLIPPSQAILPSDHLPTLDLKNHINPIKALSDGSAQPGGFSHCSSGQALSEPFNPSLSTKSCRRLAFSLFVMVRRSGRLMVAILV